MAHKLLRCVRKIAQRWSAIWYFRCKYIVCIISYGDTEGGENHRCRNASDKRKLSCVLRPNICRFSSQFLVLAAQPISPCVPCLSLATHVYILLAVHRVRSAVLLPSSPDLFLCNVFIPCDLLVCTYTSSSPFLAFAGTSSHSDEPILHGSKFIPRDPM